MGRGINAYQIPAGTSDIAVVTGYVTLYGFAIREKAGTPAAAAVTIRDALTAGTGKIIVPINLLASESAREWYGPQGIPFSTGIFWDMESGTIEGTLYLG